MGRLYSTFLSYLSPNFSFGGPIPLSLHRWSEIWRGEGDFRSPTPRQNLPHRCNLSPLRGKKHWNRPLSNSNNRRFALRAVLPVNKCCIKKGHAPCTYTYRIVHRRFHWQVRSSTLLAGHSARSQSAPFTPS